MYKASVENLLPKCIDHLVINLHKVVDYYFFYLFTQYRLHIIKMHLQPTIPYNTNKSYFKLESILFHILILFSYLFSYESMYHTVS